MDIWNWKKVLPPAITSCKLTMKEIDIRLLQISLKDAINFFENQHHLSTEAALLSRSIYRLKTKFRSSKDFKAVERLSRILRTYLHVDISRTLKFLLSCVPQNYSGNETTVLTKNVADFVLVRMQTLGKILYRILENCKICSNVLHQRLKLGHFWKVAIIIYAVVARIFVTTKTILKFACDFYRKILPFASNLPQSGVRWLPENYIFPERLEEWLNIDQFDLDNTIIDISDDVSECCFNLIDDSDDDVEICDEYIIVNDDFSFFESKKISDDVHEISINSENLQTPIESKQPKEVDIGEVIDVDEINSVKKSNNKKRKRRPKKASTSFETPSSSKVKKRKPKQKSKEQARV